jgi:hypothetical protein
MPGGPIPDAPGAGSRTFNRPRDLDRGPLSLDAQDGAPNALWLGYASGAKPEVSTMILPAPSQTLATISVPLLFPMLAATQMAEQGLGALCQDRKFLAEQFKLYHGSRPTPATENAVRLDLRTVALRDHSCPPGNGRADPR